MSSRPDSAVAIVGGGVHGVHVAVRLLEAGVDRDRLRIVEPNGLLGGFRRQCEQCGMVELRSPFVHHVDTDPFSLRAFARERGREAELVPSEVGAVRPTVELFFDHAEWVCDRCRLQETVVEATATGVDDHEAGVTVETTDTPVTTEWAVLAVGNGGSVSVPEWAASLEPSASVSHVWDPDFDPETIDEEAAVGVVGGGTTAAQLATALAQPGREVTLYARSPFRIESIEASTDWMHFGRIVDRLHDLPPASRDREHTVNAARYDGSIPPHVFSRLRRALDDGRISLERSEIETATPAGGTVVVTCTDGTAAVLDRIVCATGFGSPYDGSLFRRIRSDSRLATGYRGAPLLDDETLQWRRRDGSRSRVAVSGVAAQQVLGPFARNIIGARKAGARIVDAIDDATTRSPPA